MFSSNNEKEIDIGTLDLGGERKPSANTAALESLDDLGFPLGEALVGKESSDWLSPIEKAAIRTSRRKHKNSKNGCSNCKKRRVKCSEELPSCANCVRRKVKCGYLDYTEEQLNAHRQKITGAEDVEVPNEEPKHIPYTRTSFLSNTFQQGSPSSGNTGISGASTSDTSWEFSRNYDWDRLNNKDKGVNDVLNFEQRLVADNGDNLLTSWEYSDSPIIYPIYTMKQTTNDSLQHEYCSNSLQINLADPNFQPSRDVFKSGAFVTKDVSSDIRSKGIYGVGNIDNYHQTGLKTDASPLGATLGILPLSIEQPTRFRRIRKPNVNYDLLIYNLMLRLGQKVGTGTCPLDDLSYLFRNWLNSFYYYAFEHKLMFGCLLNFTTNYLVSNCFKDNVNLSFSSLIERTRVKNMLISSSISHYSMAVKELRDTLNANTHALLCSSASFVLSLTSIYDPAATLKTMNCFRDGLFSIIAYNLSVSLKKNEQPPLMISVHSETLKTILRSIYIPAYVPSFLNEFGYMVTTFGNILNSLNSTCADRVLDNKTLETLKFIEIYYKDLMSYSKDIITTYIPKINNNLDNLEIQQQALFEILHTWVRIFPLKAMYITPGTDPVVNVMCLFYMALKKGLFAVFPQVKFFFLREFDSPVTVDINIAEKDFAIFEKLDNPDTCCYTLEAYQKYKDQLKELASYSIRLITFFQKRLESLSAVIIYDMETKSKFPIDDIPKWRNSIVDIKKLREHSIAEFQIDETPITSFANTIIQLCHYPKFFGDTLELQGDDEYESFVDVDWLSLKKNGLLDQDFDQ